MHKNRIFKDILPKIITLKGAKNKMIINDLEPPPDDRRTHLLWAGNIDRRVGDSLLYRRWAPLGYPVGRVELVSNAPRISDNRKNSRFNKLVSDFVLRSWFGVWMLYCDDAY